jgi:seryl-tRNA synthetase
MLDIKMIAENPQKIKEGMKKRNKEVDVDHLVALDKTRRELVSAVEVLKANQNKVSKLIPQYKKEGKDVNAIFAQMKEISDKIKEDDQKIKEVEEELTDALLAIPNLPDERVVYGKDSEDNIEIRRVGEPVQPTVPIKPHWEIGSDLKILDPETAAKVTGARFHFYRGLGARLERSIINYYLNTHTESGYTEIFPPFMVNRASMTGTGQLPKFEEDAFSVAGTDYFLIPTAEVPVTNMYRDTILKGEELPLRFCAYSACFRAEAGSAGRDTRGLIRQHQFNKVELVQFVEPEKSHEALECLTEDAERVLQGLGLPYRVVKLCSGDLGFSSAQTYDIEIWMPSYGRYVEISSCSNFGDYQARRANIKYKNDTKDKAKLVHTLNGSGVAVGRTVAAILENYQNPDGTVTVPEVLRPYMGVDIIK